LEADRDENRRLLQSAKDSAGESNDRP